MPLEGSGLENFQLCHDVVLEPGGVFQSERKLVLNAKCVGGGQLGGCALERRARRSRAHLDSTGAAPCSRNISAHLGKRRERSLRAPWEPVKWAACSCGFCNQRDLTPSYVSVSLPRVTSRERPSGPNSGLRQLPKLWLTSSETFFCV